MDLIKVYISNVIDVDLKVFEEVSKEIRYVDVIVIRLEDLKKILEVISNRSFREKYPHELFEEKLERVENHLKRYLDENYGRTRRE
mmetsp:Transcript_3850/g.3789  ORF Transcript_3850/g.3789 Transcript_3850/m.3789 type:complete len:86 (-) Transcript_3850:456-713(-)